MTSVSMRQMLEAGVHFGHQTRFWNPKMAPYIFGERNKIHIINLEKTQPLYAEAANFVKAVIADGGKVLFVGTKRSARECRAERSRSLRHALRQPALAGRNAHEFQDHPSVDQASDGARRAADERCAGQARQERGPVPAPRDGKARTGAWAASRTWVPCLMRCSSSTWGTRRSRFTRRKKLGIPVVAVVDTNCSPDGIDYVIPGNDDAMRAIQLYAIGIAEAINEGKQSIPEVPAGEDEFVELDEEGNPKKKTARRRPAPPKKKAAIRRKPAVKALATEAPHPETAAVDAVAVDAVAVDAVAVDVVDSDGDEPDDLVGAAGALPRAGMSRRDARLPPSQRAAVILGAGPAGNAGA